MRLPRAQLAFALVTALCAAGYLALELEYLERLPLVMDEFDGAHDVYRLRGQIPYVDFTPYKTVVGYYLQLPVLLASRDVWSGLMNVKLQLAVMNAAFTVLAAWLASGVLSRLAVALALPAWMLVSNWLERSAELRVDLLTAWPGLFSLLFLLRGRMATAGALAGLSFLVSQKGVYFVAAAAPALLAPLVLGVAPRRVLRDALRFGAATALVIGPYLALFSLISSPAKTARTTFMAHQAIAFTEIYPNIRKFWRQTLTRNPGFYALAALGIAALGGSTLVRALRRDTSESAVREAQLFAYALSLAALGIWHKQPWPYYFVILIPTGFVACAAALELLAVRPLAAWRGAGTGSRLAFGAGALLAAALLLAALIKPIERFPIILRENNGYQRHMVALASGLLGAGERYLAAMDVLYDHEQSPKRLRRVSLARRVELKNAKPEAIAALLDELRREPPKLLIRNERFNGFPRPVRDYLASHYAPFWGNVELYAPKIKAGKQQLDLAFTGSYRLALIDKAGSALIDGVAHTHGANVELTQGPHAFESARPLRLHLRAPALEKKRDPRYRSRRELVENAYNR